MRRQAAVDGIKSHSDVLKALKDSIEEQQTEVINEYISQSPQLEKQFYDLLEEGNDLVGACNLLDMDPVAKEGMLNRLEYINAAHRKVKRETAV